MTAQRGEAPISYTDLKQLGNIIRANWTHFEDFLPSAEWATAILDAIERPRNVISTAARSVRRTSHGSARTCVTGSPGGAPATLQGH